MQARHGVLRLEAEHGHLRANSGCDDDVRAGYALSRELGQDPCRLPSNLHTLVFAI